MSLLLTPRQAHELSRISDRHGELTVRPHGDALLATLDRPGLAVVLRLDSTGHVRGLLAHAAPAPDEPATPDEPEASWVDGPGFVSWLGRDTSRLPESDRRRLSDARRGARLGVEVADRILIALGLLLSDLPDDLWTDAPTRPGRPGREAA